jgi:predicted dehydrogenase
MSKIKSKVGLIGSINPGKIKEAFRISHVEGFCMKKIFVLNKYDEAFALLAYPDAEIVNDPSSIIQDKLIDLVLVSAKKPGDTDVVAEVLQAGKHVRII